MDSNFLNKKILFISNNLDLDLIQSDILNHKKQLLIKNNKSINTSNYNSIMERKISSSIKKYMI